MIKPDTKRRAKLETEPVLPLWGKHSVFLKH
jgi:hypothetical protein